MKKSLYIFLYFFLYFSIEAINAKELTSISNWEKIKDNDGVTVYTIKTKNSDIIKVKTQVVINTSILKVQKVLDNVAHRKDWIPFLEHSSILHTFSSTEKLEYSIFSAPWPASDRDFLYRISQLRNDENKIIYSMKSEASSFMPDNEDLIRADLIESMYTLTALSKYQTNVELIFHADPKGWLPTWIINIIQKALPYMMLKNLRKQAQDPQENSITMLRQSDE